MKLVTSCNKSSEVCIARQLINKVTSNFFSMIGSDNEEMTLSEGRGQESGKEISAYKKELLE